MAQKNVRVIYDTCRQLTAQAEKLVANGQKIEQNILDTLSSSYEDIIKYVKFYLIQCQNKFYGTLLMDLDVNIEFKQRGAVDLDVKQTPFSININPLFCAPYTFSEFIGLIVNEINKMVWLHPAAYAELNSEKDPKKHEDLDKASDSASTNIVKSDMYLNPVSSDSHSNGVRLPKDMYTINKLNDECKVTSAENQTLQYYYNILKRFKKKEDSGSGNGQGNGMSGQGQSQGQANSPATRNNQDGEQTHQWEGADQDDVKETTISMISNCMNSLDEKSRGLMPLGLASQIKKLLEVPEIDWKGILRKMVGSIPVPYRKTRTRLNRRLPYRADLSGRLPKHVVNVVCCFDTSGSMSDEDLKYCMNEVFNIVKVYEGYKITVIECDADVQRVYQARKIEDLQLKMKGRGGTSFVPAIQYINGEGEYKNSTKYPLAGKFKDALMVYFTDGYGDYEIPKPRTFRNLWVVLHDVKNLSLKEPYGDVKSLSMDEKWKKLKGRC